MRNWSPILLLAIMPPAAAAPASPDAFREFAGLCARTVPLWQLSACGPMLLVDPKTRAVSANQADAGGLLQHNGATWTGTLPASIGIANTAIEWSGTRWSMVMLPLPEDGEARRVLMAHESFHRIQPALGFVGREADNGHLDGESGRVWLQLEANALAKALVGGTDWRGAARDAIAFRAERRRIAGPAAAAAEDALERNEGLAEYTGLRVGAGVGAPAAARRTLAGLADRPSFVRSFAYATGPAYGLLLDRFGGGWRQAIQRRSDATLAGLLSARIGPGGAVAHADEYGGAAIREREGTRAVAVAKRDAGYRARLVDGPVLMIRFVAMSINFNPNRVFALAGQGSVYETMQIRDAWGTLEVSDGALLASDWTNVRLAGPAVQADGRLSGPGRTITLAPGWMLADEGRVQRIVKRDG